jgi:molybdenum cofactor cytidylyltransferase
VARPSVAGLVLAAGSGERFGSPKQLALLDGRPLLEHALVAMAAARRIDTTVVVLGAYAEQVLRGVPLHGAEVVLCEDWTRGQGASLRAGVSALGERVEAIVVTLGDQPAIDPRAIDRVISARDRRSVAIRASYDGRAGHPVLFERAMFPKLAALRGDEGARSLLGAADVRIIDCDGLGSNRDIDTTIDLVFNAVGSDPRLLPTALPDAPSGQRSPPR